MLKHLHNIIQFAAYVLSNPRTRFAQTDDCGFAEHIEGGTRGFWRLDGIITILRSQKKVEENGSAYDNDEHKYCYDNGTNLKLFSET